MNSAVPATLTSPCGSLGEEADAPAAHWQVLEAVRLRAEQECKQRARERELSKPRLTPHGAEPWDLDNLEPRA